MAEPQIPALDAPRAIPLPAPAPQASPRDGPMGNGAAADLPAGRARIRPRSRARTWILAFILVAIGVAVLYTVRYFGYAGAHPTTDDAYVQGDTTIVSAKVSGRVSHVLVRGYQHVRKGDLLVELDPVDAEIALQQAQAGLETARTRVSQAAAALVVQRHQAAAGFAQAQAAQVAASARVPQSQTTVTLEDQTVRESIAMARAQLSAARAQVASTRSNLVKARNDLARAKELLAEGAVAAPTVPGFLVATVVNLGLAGVGIILLRVRHPSGVARQEAA